MARERRLALTVTNGILVEFAWLGGRFILGTVLVASGLPKLTQREQFAEAIRRYEILPRPLVNSLATWLPRLEVTVGVALIAGVGLQAAAALVAVLLLAFAAGIAINLLRGRMIDCGCGGVAKPRMIGWPLVARNLLLSSVAVGVMIVVPGPTLTGATGRLTTVDALGTLVSSLTLVAIAALLRESIRLRDIMKRVSSHGGWKT